MMSVFNDDVGHIATIGVKKGIIPNFSVRVEDREELSKHSDPQGGDRYDDVGIMRRKPWLMLLQVRQMLMLCYWA